MTFYSRNDYPKQALALWTTLLAVVALSGCGSHSQNTSTNSGGPSAASGGPSAASGGPALQIAVIPKGTSHEYWKSIHAGAIKAQQDLAAQGTNVNILWKGTESEGDRNGQVNIVEGFVTQHVSGIVLAPLDNQALTGSVHDAVTRKIPVVVMDSPLNGTDWSSVVATDNEKGGELAGEQLAKLLGGKGRVLLLPYAQGSASTQGREQGFLRAVKKYPGISVLSSNQYGGPTTDTAYKTTQNLLARFGSQTDGVFASNETNTRGMRLALKDANLLHRVKFVGFDAASDLVDALKAGEINALIVQNPFKMGETGVQTAVAVLKGQKVDKSIDTGVAVVTTDNMNQPQMQQFLHPPIDQYLRSSI